MKIFKKPAALILPILIFSTFLAFAQKEFEGTVIYTINYIDMPPEMEQMKAMLPQNTTIHIKGNKSRMEQTQMMGSNVIVSDMDAKIGFMEMDMGGQKIRINVAKEEFEKESNQMKNIEYFDDTKTILGYTCKRAVLKDDSGQIEITVYYTDKITNKAQKEFAGLNGFPLQYSMTQQNMTMEMVATELNEVSISEDIFAKSDGFRDMTQQELQQMMGGGR